MNKLMKDMQKDFEVQLFPARCYDKRLTLVYADSIGHVSVEVDTEYAISFCGNKVYFSVDGVDQCINVNQLLIIKQEG